MSDSPPMKRYTSHFLLLALLLLAAFLRFYRLDAQSFWNDEGNSARIAERSLDLILEGAEGDIHPPGYYLLLHYWRAWFGQSEFALRSLSVVAGLMLVVCTYLLGRRLFDQAVGLTAAFLGAISPFAVYYSQEARMYALLAALSAASTYAFLRLLQIEKPGFAASGAQKGWFLAYVLTSAAGLYTQYAFPFVLFVHNAVFGLWWLAVGRRSANRRRWLALWVGTQTTIAVLYLPWLRTAIKSVSGWSSAGQVYELRAALVDVLRVLSVGVTLPVEEATAAIVGIGALLLMGLWPRRTDRAGRLGVASLSVYLLLPIALIFAFDLYKPSWLKFLVVVLPPSHILIAHGIGTMSRFPNPRISLRILLPASCALFFAPSLCNLYFDPAYARDDYRQIAADIAALARPGDAARRSDAIILSAPNQWEVFTYYYPDQNVYPAPYRPDRSEVETFLESIIVGESGVGRLPHRRLFVLYWGDAESDPHRFVETGLSSHAYKAGDQWYGRVRLATYGVASLPEEPLVALDARFGEAIRLRGYALPEGRLTPGDILPVTLFWEAQAPMAERYKVTIQLLDGAGQLVAQYDSEPRAGLMPTTIWNPDQPVVDRYGAPLPPNLPSAHYTLIVGLYHLTTGERLPVTLNGELVGNHLALSQIQVVSP
jgi:mannosyltransferase